MENNEKNVDYRKVLAEIWKRRKLYFIGLPITVVLASLYIVCIPRTYQTDTEMVPEVAGDLNAGSGTLSSLASTFGFDMSNIESSDAITPMLYPDLMTDNGFVTSLFVTKVKTLDNQVHTDYYSYLTRYQKSPWWGGVIGSIKGLFSKPDSQGGTSQLDPYRLSRKQADVVKGIQQSISIKVDKKTGAITISVTAQDPLVAKIVADSTRRRLEGFITKYRTQKARRDFQYYKQLTAEAHADYQRLRQRYVSFADANEDAILQSVRSRQEDMENEMQLKYNAYTTLSAQLEAARAKLQAKTPAFTLIRGAALPVKPAGPKRMMFVVGWAFFVFFAISIYVLRDIILPKNGQA